MVGDEVVEFGLGEGLFINFLNLGRLMRDDGVDPGLAQRFVACWGNAEFCGNSFEARDGVAGEGLLGVLRMCHDIDSCKGSKDDAFAYQAWGVVFCYYYITYYW